MRTNGDFQGNAERPYEWHTLEWDTNYFGVSAGKVILNIGLTEMQMCEVIKESCKYDFITIINRNNRSENNRLINIKTPAFLTDVNIQFSKSVTECFEIALETRLESNKAEDQCILEIAKNTFGHSRFFNDVYLDLNKSKNIYLNWTRNAFKEPDKYFITVYKDNTLAGYLLFSLRASLSEAVIELIAVDKVFRGQHVGQALINKLESYLLEQNIERIRVGTQVDNLSAINFYLSKGFKCIERYSIYHYWPKINLPL
ncbi:GNAT family N-acetyltransferase [Asaccharospora irregularis]|uniref:Ribosomal protein S18 acetylase RimI n=1 Tax=Asaccharospora irregularis DSM 2635 TaxID=1121321 RepID=A0A1M5PFU8_9FIRM|nr:GNAT family N-acetyltransferase [Asaccharospora irregularis]SHH00369.1 Ribosomal protein S18 acetylase RimI [Asaccharospora irregularis DSM 2635]